jgi:hypothetical protein
MSLTVVALAFAALGLFLVAGLPLSYALTRNALPALLLAPLIAALTAAGATTLMLVLGGRLSFWLVPLLVAQWVGAVLLLRRRPQPLPFGTWAEAGWLLLPLAPPLLLAAAAPIQWDANSIWFTHAAYFIHGAQFARSGIGSPTLIAHTDYPPLTSSSVAAVWELFGSTNLYLAQFVTSIVTVSAIATLVYAMRYVTRRAPVVVSRVVAVGVGLAAWSGAPVQVLGGMSDVLAAAAFVAAAALLLVGDDPWVRPAIPLVLMTVAALTKNEGLVMAGILAAAVTLRELRNLRRAWLVWLPIAAGVTWVLLVRHLGAVPDVAKGEGVRALLTGDPTAVSRVAPTVVAIGRQVGTVLAICVCAAGLGAVFLRRQRRVLGLGSDLWIWGVTVAYAGSLLLTYATGPYVLAWWFSTSMNRVTVSLTMLACVSAATWVTTASAAHAGTVPVERDGLPPQPHVRDVRPLTEARQKVAARSEHDAFDSR